MYHMTVTVFVDMHSIMCYLCIAIICWWGPVYSDTVACCLSDGHNGWWVGFWSGRYHVRMYMLATFVMHLVSVPPSPLHVDLSAWMIDRDVYVYI